jgi:hypothetical protein
MATNKDFIIKNGLEVGAITSSGNLLLDSANAEINLKSGGVGTNGAVNWTFNTTGTNYASIQLPYDTRATTGLHIDSGYPITVDATTRIDFDISGSTKMVMDTSGLSVTGTVTATGGNSTNWNTAYGWGNHASASYITGNQTITLSGDVSGSGTTSIAVTVADDSHNHIISNVDGLQTALDAKLASSSYTAADVLTKIKTVDGSGSDLDADLLDGRHLQQIARYQSGSDFANGTLVTTNIVSSNQNGDSFVIEITGKAYGSSKPHSVIAEGYLYNNSIISTSGTNISGNDNFTYLKVMNNGGYLSFWWPRHAYWNSYDVHVRSSSVGTSNYNRVTAITDSVDPSGATKKIQINLAKTWNSDNDSSGSGLDADLLDGNQASAFATSAQGTLATNALPKAGGTMTGTLAMGANAITSTGTISSGAITATNLTLNQSGHNYFAIETNDTSYEAMTRYKNGLANYWYTGLRTSAGIVGTSGYHIYSTANGDDVGGYSTAGVHHVKSGYAVGATTVIDASRNLTNIGTISSGAITSTGVVSMVSRAEIQGSGGWAYTRLLNGGSVMWDIAANPNDNSSALQFRPSGSGTNATLMSASGNWTFGGTITSTGYITSSNAKMGVWNANGAYSGIFHTSHASSSYGILFDATSTFVGSGTGGSTHIRYDNNSSANQLVVNSSGWSMGSTVVMDGSRNLTNIGRITMTSYNQPVLLNASGTGSAGSAMGFQQATGEGWSGIFVDYNPNEGWGLYHDNPSNYFYITAESTGGSLGTSFTVPRRGSGSSTAYAKIRFDQNNGNLNAGGAITANGNITAYASDKRLKTNFRPIENPLDKIKQLNGLIFDWNEVAETNGFIPDTKTDDMGLIAQEVQKVAPQAVDLAPFDTEITSTPHDISDKNAGNIEEKKSISGNNYLTVKYDKLVPLLVEAIK